MTAYLHTMRRLVATEVVLLLAACDPGDAPTQPTAELPSPPHFFVASNSWVAKASMPTGRAWPAAGVAERVPGQPLLYVIGGSDPQNDVNATDVVEAYDFATNSWSEKASLPIPLTRSNGVGLIGGKLYISGGSDDNKGGLGILSRLYVYDPARNTWTRKRNMPLSMEQGVTGVINSKLYVLGGGCNTCGPADLGRRFYRYDPTTNVWSSLPSCPQAHEAGAGGVINGKFYVVGGLGRNGTFTNQLDVYDPTTKKWATKAALPGPPRDELAAAVVNGKLFILGGSPVGNPNGVTTNHSYDPGRNTWTTMAPMPIPRRAHAAATLKLAGNAPRIFVIGGVGTGTLNEVYKP